MLLKREFERRGPWVTRFEISGRVYGGAYDAEKDVRLRAFFEHFPKPERVLELGALEGGHSFPLARQAGSVVAVESRQKNVDRAQWIARLLHAENVQFVRANLETFDFAGWEGFDVIFNVGLLYHLPRPWELLQKLSRLAPAMFVWTHVAKTTEVEAGGYRGAYYSEHGVADPLSGMSARSFWPTLAELQRMLVDAGFDELDFLDVDDRHPHGPAVLLACQRGRLSALGAQKMENLAAAAYGSPFFAADK